MYCDASFFWKGKKLLSSEGVRLIHLFYQQLRYCMSHIVYINYNTTTLLTFPLTSCCWVIVCLILFTSILQHNHLTYFSIDQLLLCYCMSHIVYIYTTTQPPYLPFHWPAVVVLLYVSYCLHLYYNTTTLLTFLLTSCCWVIVCLILFTSTTTQPPYLPFQWPAVVVLLYVSYCLHPYYNTTTLLTFPLTSCCCVIVCLMFFTSQLQHNHLTYLSIDKLLLSYCMSHIIHINHNTTPIVSNRICSLCT